MIRILWGSLITAGLGLLSSMILFIFQDDIKKSVLGVDLVADVYLAPWQPYPVNGSIDPKEVFSGNGLNRYKVDELTRPGHLGLIFIEVKNFSNKDIRDVRVNFAGDKSFDFLVVDKKSNERVFIGDGREVRIPIIDAKDTVYVYIWTGSTLNAQYYVEDISVFSSEGGFQVIFNRYDRYDERVLGIKYAKWFDLLPAMIYGLLVIMVIISFTTALTYIYYARRLLGHSDFYLEEAARFEVDPDKFVPKIKQNSNH